MLVIHGDEYDVVTKYSRWLAVLGSVGYELLMAFNRGWNILRRFFGYKNYWSLSAYVKHKVKSAVNFISNFEETLASSCKKQGYDGVIAGHIHHAEIREIDGIEYMNCGDWVESCTALAEKENGEICIIDYRTLNRFLFLCLIRFGPFLTYWRLGARLKSFLEAIGFNSTVDEPVPILKTSNRLHSYDLSTPLAPTFFIKPPIFFQSRSQI